MHRDLKPANIIVGPGGQAKILDFGLAKMLVGEAAENGARTPSRTDDPLTEVGVAYGSMGYGSPEQAAGQEADHRSDVFSLGPRSPSSPSATRPTTPRPRSTNSRSPTG